MKTRNHSVRFNSLPLFFLFGALILRISLAHSTQLTVGLYPYVPRVEQFQAAVTAEWSKVQPDVQLHFLTFDEWDGGYTTNPPAGADVYVFDALFFESYRQQGLMEPLAAGEISNIDDFLPYALEGVKANGQFYAIPQLGCANLLIYDRRDTPITNATTIDQLTNTLKQCTYTSQIPPDRRGLLIAMGDGLTDAALYLDTAHEITQQYPYPQPATPADLDPSAIADLKQVLTLSSFLNATTPTPGQYDFATYFSNGWGRAYVGFSESMSQLSDDARSNIAFKVMPFSNAPPARADFYADVIAVNPTVNQRGTRTLAIQLANVMAATETMVKSTGRSGNLPPQYLMVTRPSIFQALKKNDSIYARMASLANSSNPVMFKLNSQGPAWLSSMQDNIEHAVLENPSCGCGYPAAQPITDKKSAAAICPNTCNTHGGWNGQWTNAPPATNQGSVCGCNSCPTMP
jgi:thiamine pyridinylase